ncbi:TetR/AcrR family transcriptional regulator [Rhodococcus sp. HNM0569]|uniref:TetR/AcrR family transcriptional regulator n=1 Tax=Rhodococcus sp. HNM0569 TaxID=2716340 RepID=UPI003211D52A
MTTTSSSSDASARADAGLRERKKRQTRRDIARAAYEAVSELGLDGATVETIAERAGVSTRTFFNYFDTKDDAVVAMVVDRFAGFADAVRELPPSDNPVTEVRDALIRFVAERRADFSGDDGVEAMFEHNPGLHRSFAAALTRFDAETAAALAARHPDDPCPARAAAAALAVGFGLLRLVMLDVSHHESAIHDPDGAHDPAARLREYYRVFDRHPLA